MSFTFPEHCKWVQLNAVNTAANALACDYICTKNAHRVWFLISHYSAGGDTDLVVSFTEATDVAAGTTSAVTATFPIWSNTAVSTSSDTLVRRTDAASYTIDTGAAADYAVVLEWDPAKHTDGYDCITVSGSGGNASNVCHITAVIDERYKADQPPSAIID